MKTINPQVFRRYDIRGHAERDLAGDFAQHLGRAIGHMIQTAGAAPAGRRHAVAVGRDCRLTSPALAQALMRGICDMGVDVVDVGTVPTPLLYFACFHFDVDGGVEVTGSHNPPSDNGFKILRGTETIHGTEIAELRARMLAGDLAPVAEEARGEIFHRDVETPYLAHAQQSLRLGPRRGKVVLDAGNGAGGPVAVALYRQLGFEVVELYCDMDGRFPNHHPDPTMEENLADLKARVCAEGADCGIALDGDGDRVGAVDGQGRVLWGDQLMILLGRAILQEVPGATFIGEVKCSQTLYDELAKAGGNVIMWKVGHSLIKSKMKDVGAHLAGEMSGHIFFAHRYLGFDDGVYAGARLLELLSQTEQSLAQLYDELPAMVATPEIRIDCADGDKFTVVERAIARLRQHPEVVDVIDIDGMRANFGDGWGLLRASNTQPAIIMRCEAATGARLEAIRALIAAAVDDAIKRPRP